jgi:hypothetical protein
MIGQDGVLVQLLRLVDRIPTPPPPLHRPRGRPIVYPERLFLKALVVMIVRHLHKVGELLAVLEEPTPEMKSVRELLKEEGHFPRAGEPSRGGSRPCPRLCPSRSVAWDATWSPYLSHGRARVEQWPSIPRCSGPKAANGIRRTGRPAWYPIPP